MLDLLRNLNDRAEELQGQKLITMLVVTFVLFIFVGFSTNYVISNFLKSNELFNNDTSADGSNGQKTATFDGVITYVDPRRYPQDEISYFLADTSGKQIILLAAEDQKLEVSEGLFVSITGRVMKTQDGKNDVIIVEKVAINSR